MDDHCLSFDNMYDLMSCESLSQDNRDELLDYNAHLIKCADCRNLYNQSLALYETIESWTPLRHHEVEQKIKHLKLCLALKKAQKASTSSIAAKIEAWMEHMAHCGAKLKLKIDASLELAAKSLVALPNETQTFAFVNACFAATRGDEPVVNHKILIDGNNALNRIQISDERELMFRFDLDRATDPPLIAIVPEGDTVQARICELAYNDATELWEFNCHMPPGEYDILIELSK